MRCIPRLSFFVLLAALCATPAYSAQTLFGTVRVNSSGVVLGPGMDGGSESPPNGSLGFGNGTALYDDVAHTLQLNALWTGLSGTVTQSHIHTPTTNPFLLTASVVVTPPSLAGFPTGAGTQSGSYSQLLNLADTATYSTGFVTANGGTAAGAEAALISQFTQGKSYWNIHSTSVPGGEIRGFFLATPEPASCTLLFVGLAGVCCAARRR